MLPSDKQKNKHQIERPTLIDLISERNAATLANQVGLGGERGKEKWEALEVVAANLI